MPAYDSNNIFAKVLRGELPCYKVYEDDKALAFLDIMPRSPGHTLVIPKAPARNILDITPEEWESVLQVNLTSILRLCQMVLPGMRDQGWGRIVNVSSLAGRAKSLVAGGSYMASKAGVLGLTRAIAAEMGPHGITANAITPGRILTEMAQQAAPSVNENYAAQIPARRLGTPEEVAAAMVFLAAEEAGFINGAILDINGGFYMP